MDRRRVAFFIPGRGCGRRCVYCDQLAITTDAGGGESVTPGAVRETVAAMTGPVELCFFGGSFARVERAAFVAFLDAIRAARPGSAVTFSSYPGDFDGEYGRQTAQILKRYPIGTIELGIPSLDPNVLKMCGRDDDPEKIKRAVVFLRDLGFRLGIQMMIGLPGQSAGGAMRDVETLAALMPETISWDFRLYPCLVLRGTELEAMWARGAYRPLGLDEAARLSGVLLLAAEKLGFNVIRVGLIDSESLKKSVAAGPYHPAFGELAMSEKLALEMFSKNPRGPWEIGQRNISLLTGHGGRGIKRLAELGGMTPEEAMSAVCRI
ncbi:MAG: radical SAM protein [Synergistaceae bacterium]|nr:radical SAM protein [Synergistaceae bacterium]